MCIRDSRNEVAGQFAGVSIFFVSDLRAGAVEVVHADVFNFKENLATGGDTGIGQIFHHFVLRVNRNSLSVGEIPKINTVTAASKAQLDSVVDQALGCLLYTSRCV